MELIKSMLLDDLMASPVGQRLQQAMADWNLIQESLSAFRSSDDSNRLKLLKIGSVFQLFLIDFLASGKKFNELTEDDWRGIAEEVSRYAIKEEDYPYSVLVFSRYADYIRISANSIGKLISKDRWDSIMALAGSIDTAGERFRRSEINESEYVQACLWDSLEAMIKLFSSSLTSLIGEEYTQLAEAVSQFAFEYGRYLLYAKERALLDE